MDEDDVEAYKEKEEEYRPFLKDLFEWITFKVVRESKLTLNEFKTLSTTDMLSVFLRRCGRKCMKCGMQGNDGMVVAPPPIPEVDVLPTPVGESNTLVQIIDEFCGSDVPTPAIPDDQLRQAFDEIVSRGVIASSIFPLNHSAHSYIRRRGAEITQEEIRRIIQEVDSGIDTSEEEYVDGSG